MNPLAAQDQLQRQQLMSLFNQQNQHTGVLDDSRPQSGATPAYFALDPSSAAKQMAALNATSQHRRASQSGGTSDTVFGPRQASLDSTPDNTTAGPQANRGPAATAQVLKSRRDEFLKFVAGVMNARHTPLPHAITGIPSAYDPATSRWKAIEPTVEPGGFRLATKDVDLFKLWQLVLSHGGHAKLTRENSWGALLSHFGLPDELSEAQPNGNTSVARILAHYYMALLAPFEEVYLRNMQQQQQKAMQARQQQQQQQQFQQQGQTAPPNHDSSLAGPSSLPSQASGISIPFPNPMSVPSPAQHPYPDLSQQSGVGGSIEPEHHPIPSHNADAGIISQRRLSNPATQIIHAPASGTDSTSVDPVSFSALSQGIGSEDDSRKRKFQGEEMEKRARQRTDSSGSGQDLESTKDAPAGVDQRQMTPQGSQGQVPSPSRPSTSASQSTRQPRMRRKIEYVPLAREVDTYGGRDLDMIDAELAKVAIRRPQRPIDDWGAVDIEGVTMSLRSRLPTELSYAITVLSVLSTMRGQSPDTGFSLQQCDDLLDELLDLLREQAFSDAEDEIQPEAEIFWTHRELVSFVHDHELQTFSDLPRTKTKVTSVGGPKPSPADIVSAILNLFRNFSLTGENQRYMGQHPGILGLLLRICSLSLPPNSAKERPPLPNSPALSLPDVVRARRDVLTIVSNLVPFTNLASHAPHTCTRLFELLASFLVEPHDISSPSGVVLQSGAHNPGMVRPPLVVDLALEAFSKLAQPDANRLALSRGITFPWLWSLFTSLVHRLPVSTEDFTITMRMHDVWLSYVEKVVLSIYSICFLASPELKAKIRTDRTLGFPKLILRMVKRFVGINHPDARQYFLVSSRRAVEALKLIDEGGDAFESPQSNGPLFAFGMGFGEADSKQTESGVGLLAGFQDDVTWNIMMMPHIDDIMFAELDSLARIGV